MLFGGVALAAPAGAVTGYEVKPGVTTGAYFAPDPLAEVLAAMPGGQPLDIACQLRGGDVDGSTVWDQLTDGSYVPDRDVTTPLFNEFTPGLPQCGVAYATPGRVNAGIDEAIAWAASQVGSTSYRGLCLLFVARAYGFAGGSGEYSAYSKYQEMAAAGQISTEGVAPRGALVFFGPAPRGLGHIMISLGDGRVIGGAVNNAIGEADLATFHVADGADYLGWANPDFPHV